MANKQKESKPGSRYAGIPWDDGRLGRRSFNDMIDVMRQKKVPGYRKINGPMAKRASIALLYIQSKGEGGIAERAKHIESDIIKKLIKDGSIMRKRITDFSAGNQGYTLFIATSFPEIIVERIAVPHARKQAELMEAGLHYPGKNKGKVRVDDTQTIKWTKQKDQQLILDILAGTANEDVVQQVGKTKTKMRKIKKIAK